ncbi:ferredoxin [Mycobacterium sp. 21AC1]|uniref:ferredoxin n=1 Tax=[Mycobacterium] appelbergii TaxID=2939269 RepID=UPI00293938B2|nr:ferredoxin [Mycobacterium sp. 21AC1]MDV3129000.1 ferredoxin [Mycobacterium sp. 21AC1]
MSFEALGRRVEVDRRRCEGHAQCVATAPHTLQLDDDGDVQVIGRRTAMSATELDDVAMAVSACPMNALRLLDARPDDPGA